MPKVSKSALNAKSAKNNSLFNREAFPFIDMPHSHFRGCPNAPDVDTQEFTAVPLHKQLVGAQIDGVSLNNTTLLQREYDDEFGVVDPASDIHTDPHMLQDALMRRELNNKIASLPKE